MNILCLYIGSRLFIQTIFPLWSHSVCMCVRRCFAWKLRYRLMKLWEMRKGIFFLLVTISLCICYFMRDMYFSRSVCEFFYLRWLCECLLLRALSSKSRGEQNTYIGLNLSDFFFGCGNRLNFLTKNLCPRKKNTIWPDCKPKVKNSQRFINLFFFIHYSATGQRP